MTHQNGMLGDVKVLDFSQVIAGPFATMQMALQGADVIKIERPGSGDMMRDIMSKPPYSAHSTSAGFLAFNSGKRSLSLDLKMVEAKYILAPLIEWADVVVESFRPGVMKSLGLDAVTLMSTKPSLVYCSISGYGQKGPKSRNPAFDGAIQAESGMMSVTGWPNSDPLRAGFFAVDIPTGYAAAFAMTSALLKARATGAGAHIDLAMMDTALTQMSMQIGEYYQTGTMPERLGNMSAARMASDSTYRTLDGAIAVVALNSSQITALHTILGLHQPADADAMADVFALASSADWAEKLHAANVPCSIVRSLDMALEDEQLEHRSVLPHPPAPAGFGDKLLTVAGAPFMTTSSAPELSSAPSLGEHSTEILLDCGFSKTQIRTWQDADII